MNKDNTHFFHIFWFIVGIVGYGMILTIFLIVYLPEKIAERFADTALIFWLSTAVSGGIGYLLGSNATDKKGSGELTAQQPESKGTTTIELKKE